MPSASLPPTPTPTSQVRLIETSDDLAAICGDFCGSPILAVDTEFISERTYRPVLELVQVADDGGRIALIDARHAGDLKSLGGLLDAPGREIVFHAASEDIGLLARETGCRFERVFDTQLAAAMVGFRLQMGHSALVQEMLGVRPRADQTTSDWSRRPLTPAQIAYAADDVRYLHKIRAELLEQLRTMGRESWFREEQARRAAESRSGDEPPDEERYRTIRGGSHMSRGELAILRELAAWREAAARRRDVPRQQVIPDSALVILARRAPATRQQAFDLRELPKGRLRDSIDELIEVIHRAKAIPPDQWPRKEHRPANDTPEGLVNLLQALVRVTAEAERIAPALLATTSELEALAAYRHRVDRTELAVLTGWRRAIIGERLLALLEGRLALRIHDRDRLVFEAPE